MINLFALLAQTTTRPTDVPWWAVFFQSPIFLMVMLLVIFYVFMIRSKKNQERQRQDMLSSIKKGDRVQTIGGIIGSVVEARDDEVLVKVDESQNTKIRFARSAIHRVVESDRPQVK